MRKAKSIEEVIQALDLIIERSEQEESAMGYFAALYRRVTIEVREGIQEGYFEDGDRMEKLDVVFAQRYIDAYYAWMDGAPCSISWQRAFQATSSYWPTTLQHLLLGMNAHINLDLGVAAAAISEGMPIQLLKDDFNKINEILSSLVGEVQEKLIRIWPNLHWILQKTRNVDDFLVDFSMEIARNGAWKFACGIALLSGESLEEEIRKRDSSVGRKADLVVKPGKMVQLLLGIIRLGEKGSNSQKIRGLV
ncbi:MAG: hypothetical protein GYB31_15245 [Bacteroidetes bacterium]|nr:hypothetical protein [Bacteroidota bacterium]